MLLQPFVYFKNDDVKTVKKKANMQTVILKIKMKRLFLFLWILVLRIIRKIIFEGLLKQLKSKDFTQLGLYPIFNKKLELNALIYGK